MHQEQVSYIINDYLRQSKKYYKIMVKQLDAEAIHQFRLRYKKLNALFRRLCFETAIGKEIKMAKKLKVLFHVAGRIRELQLQLLRIKTFGNAPTNRPLGYEAWLLNELHLAQQILLSISTSQLWHLGKKKKQQLSAFDYSANSFRQFAQVRWLFIHQLLSQTPLSDDGLHQVRKQLKTLQYNLDLFKQADYEQLSLEVYPPQGESYFKNMLDLLGLFQDACNRLNLLNAAVLEKLNIDQRIKLTPIKHQWQQEKEQLKKEVKTELQWLQSPINQLTKQA